LLISAPYARSAETGKDSKKAWKDWNGDDWNWAGMYPSLAEELLLAEQFHDIIRLKPNSITLAGSTLVRSWSQTASKLVGDQLRTSSEPASNQLQCLYWRP